MHRASRFTLRQEVETNEPPAETERAQQCAASCVSRCAPPHLRRENAALHLFSGVQTVRHPNPAAGGEEEEKVENGGMETTTRKKTRTRARRCDQHFRSDKTVRFAPQMRVKLTLPLSEYTKSEMKSSWYSKDDLTVIQKDVVETVHLVRKGGASLASPSSLERDHGKSARGIENMILRGGTERRKTRIKSAVDSVLEEQEWMRETGRDPVSSTLPGEEGAMKIAEASRESSRGAREDAARRGKADAKAAGVVVPRTEKMIVNMKQQRDSTLTVIKGLSAESWRQYSTTNVVNCNGPSRNERWVGEVVLVCNQEGQ